MAYQPEPVVIEFDFATEADYRIIPTHWFDAINSVSASYSIRDNFVFINDFYVDGTYSFSTRAQPLAGIGDVYVNDTAKNYLTFDENWFAVGTKNNPNSFKDSTIHYGEGFSRKMDLMSFEAFTYSTGGTSSVVTKINFTPGQNLSEPGDRVLIVKTDGVSETSAYNTYAKVLSSSNINGWIIVDLPFIPYPYPQTGYFYEGMEFIDYRYSSDGATIETSLSHNLNPGDRIVIQMDTFGRMSFTLGGAESSGQVLTGIFLDGYNLLPYGVTYSGSPVNFYTEIQNVTNYGNPIDGFRAYYPGSPHTYVYFFTNRRTNSYYEGMSPTFSGTLTSVTASTVHYLPGDDEFGNGFNPQITGYYNVVEVPTTTTFTLENFLPVYYGNIIGSDRGTVYSLTDYKFRDLTIGETYSYIFSSIDTQNDLEPIDDLTGVLGTFVTDDTTLPNFLSARNIIGNESVNTYKVNMFDIDFYSTYEVFTIDILNSDGFTASSPYGIDSYVVDRIFATYSDTLTFSGANLSDEKISLGWGPWNLNEFFSLNPGSITPFFNPGTDPFPIPEDIVSYTISGYNTDSFTPKKITKTLRFNKKCSERMTFQLAWLNEWGGWDYYTFFSPLQKTYRFTRNNFYKSGNYRDGVRQVTSNPKSRGETTFNMDRDLELKLFTDYLTLAESKLIESLISSGGPIYLIKPNNPHDDTRRFIYPCVILAEELKLHSPVSKLRYYEIDIRMGGYNFFSRQAIN